jgi:hypothetical protein
MILQQSDAYSRGTSAAEAEKEVAATFTHGRKQPNY